jgi:hypothetical protein
MPKRALIFFFTVGLLFFSLSLTASAAEKETKDFVCGTLHPDSVLKQYQEAIQRGEVPDKSLLPAPRVGNLAPVDHDSITPKIPVTPADLFLFEDTNHRMVNPFNTSILLNLMVEAANALIARDGDLWDIIAFYCAFTPHEASQSSVLAFYIGVKNNVSGIGLSSFNNHGSFGLAGSKAQGVEMQYGIASWDGNTSELGDLTEMVVAHEFQHRFSVFWAPTDNGLALQQGSDTACGPGGAHWNFRVDNQGSCIDAQEWTGSSPAIRDFSLCLNGGYNCFNSDIGGTYSYTDLYAMGYVTPTEMDAGNSELRYMEDNCSSPYNSTITSFTSANIIATNGDRIPDAASAQHSFRTAWIVLYQPGDPPSTGELQRVADIVTRYTQDYHFATLDRGIMDNSILPPFVMATSPASMAASINSFDPEADHFIPSLDTVGFNVQVTDSVGTHDPSSGLLHYSVNGGAYQTAPLVSLGGGTYHATLPALPCEQSINYYVSFLTSDSSYTITEPLGSSTTPFSAISVSSDSLIFADEFETDMGWTVGFTGDAATTGIWTRVDPIGTGAQPEDDNDTGSGTMCYITGQGPPYGDTADYLGKNDVDGGKTSLISPAFDLSGKNGVVRYARWYSNNSGATPNTDKMTVTISNNNGVTFPETLEVVTENQVGWVTKQFVVNHYITPSSQMKVRFEASDLGSGSLVEAGVDDFQAYTTEISVLAGDANASGNYTLGDIIAIVNYIFNKSGCVPTPTCWLSGLLCRGDWNGDGNVSLSDVIRGVNYIFNKPNGPWNPVPVGACCRSI